ncbi:hypothetical protein BZB76_0254 [Actinomadura pelletieri DSM 43383]|uniref:Uncharacterized protein n=1 Tax=Actinomadura pelletieri DSM 43383 TaxID=1120940 RepID=A0A495QXH4_9ACTN|nr:hypothetical protein [Actinomadura pelletieri]RKS78820.1 hypothetical protein BZB76_0254 [Actinomadura pelletieri DSM 43383]
MPDFALPADIPLGPFEGTQITLHAAKSKGTRLHADPSCSALRTRDVRSLTLPLNAETIARLCRQCDERVRWMRPGTALSVFLRAVMGTGLCYELDTYSTPDEEEWTEEEVTQAALLLHDRDYPPEDGEDEAEDLWTEFSDARDLREWVFLRWARAAESLHRALTVVTQYPWLEPWARPKLDQKSKYVEVCRERAGRFCHPKALLAATAVFQAPDPELPADDPAFAVLGDATTVRTRLNRLWQSWKEAVASDWLTPVQHSSVVYDLEHGIERKRKKRDAVLAQGRRLIAEWAAQAQAMADVQPDRPEQPILARVSKNETHEGRPRGDFVKSMPRWDLAVLATYTVEADWGRRTMLLRVPSTVGERLLAGGSSLSCTPGDDGLPTAPDPQEADESLTPGVLDDTPVAERRPIAAAHLRALRMTDEALGEQLAVVLSVENGVEVLPVSVIEKRCEDGWRGVYIAAVSDLPASLIDPWMQRLSVETEADPEREWSDRNLPPHDPNFARHLGVAAGEAWLQRMLSAPYIDLATRARALRCLALARNVHDLRTLESSFDYRHHTIPDAVWRALLAADLLDLQPFHDENENEFLGGGIGAPLGPLAEVQIYTTNADPAAMGKGHSPYCSHSRGPTTVSEYDDLLTAADLLSKDFDWCSKCGGYAPRRLTDRQLDYYRAAHHLHSIAQRLRRKSSWPGIQEMANIQAELDTLRKWRPADDADWRGGHVWRWKDIVERLSAQARQIASTLTDPSAGGEVIRFRQPDDRD